MALVVGQNKLHPFFGYGMFDVLSVSNSAKALYYFALGLPAFAVIKVFSTFLFARDDTKTPFYYSLISVLINISISIYFFDKVGFIIIPIATTISSLINFILLFFKLSLNNYFNFKNIFNITNLKTILISLASIYIFYILINLFKENMAYDNGMKLFAIILLVFVTILIYILMSFLTKTFKYSDIKLKY